MGIVNTASGLAKTGLATVAYPFAALGTGVRAGVADAIGAQQPTDTAADAVSAFGASGVNDLKTSFNEDVARLKKVAAFVFGLTPSAPPTVVGQTPAAPAAPAATATPGARTSAEIDKTIANTPIDTAPAVPANKYDDVVAAAVAKSANKFSDLAMPGYTNIGASVPVATPVAAPVAPVVKAPTINAPLMEQQQNLMAQIAAAQQVVAAGSNRDGYKMGDVTKALMTMNHLSPLVASTNSLLGNMYGTDAGMINHATDNATRVSIADAGNATEMAKTNLAGQYGIQGRALDNEAAVNLAERKAAIDAASPQSAKATQEAAQLALENAAILKGGFGALKAPQYHYSTDPITGKVTEVWENGVPGVDPRAAAIATKTIANKNKGK